MSVDDPSQSLQQDIGYQFRNPELLAQALHHPSYAAESKAGVRDNQRLEFLGDAVIQIVITEKIYSLYPEMPEGRLTKIRSALSKQATLAQFARQFQLGSYLRLGHGERKNRGHERPSVLCDAFEALIGAIYLDEPVKLTASREILNRCIDAAYTSAQIATLVSTENPKGALQEWSQKRLNEMPVYQLLSEIGPDHEKEFTIAVTLQGIQRGVGSASKRQTAEEQAAKAALEAIEREG